MKVKAKTMMLFIHSNKILLQKLFNDLNCCFIKRRLWLTLPSLVFVCLFYLLIKIIFVWLILLQYEIEKSKTDKLGNNKSTKYK